MSLGHVGHVKSGHYGLTTLEERDTKMRKLLSVMFLATFVAACVVDGQGDLGTDGSVPEVDAMGEDAATPPPDAPPGAPTLIVTATPMEINLGDSTTINWLSTNTASCTSMGLSQPLNGTYADSPDRDTVYTVVCTGLNGVGIMGHVNVTVIQPPPPPAPTVDVSATFTTINLGQNTTVTWTSTNAESCTNSETWSQSPSGTFTVYPTMTTTYAVVCEGPGGQAQDSVTVTVVLPPPPPAPTLTVTANPTTITVGGASTISWSTTNATSCKSWFNGAWVDQPINGTPVNGTAWTVSPTTTTVYSLHCTGPGGTISNGATVTVNAAPPPPAPTMTMSANPTTIPVGGNSTITWSSTNTTSCSSTQGTHATSGTWTVSPATTTTYSITCSGPGGSITRTALVTVHPAPTLNFTANPTTITVGDSSCLSWSSSNTTGCTVDSASKPTSGSITVSPSSTKTYTATCTGPGGSITKTVTVTVNVPPPPPAPTLSFSATPATITVGQNSTLSWSTANADTCTATGSWNGSKPVNGTLVVSPTSNAKYQLSCTGPGGTVTKTADVWVNALPNQPPAVNITSPSNGATFTTPVNGTITANASDSDGNVTKVEFYANGVLLPSGTDTTAPFSVTLVNQPIPAGSYSLTAKAFDDDNASTVSAAVNVTVTTLPELALTFTAEAVPAQMGGGYRLVWDSTHADTCNSTGAWTAEPRPVDGSVVVNPTAIQTHTYTLTCTRTAGGSITKSVNISVTAPPANTMCHGEEAFYKNSDLPNIDVCKGWSATGVPQVLPKGNIVSGPDGVCAITCHLANGLTVMPVGGSSIWMPGAVQDSARRYTTGCSLLPGHTGETNPPSGVTWDLQCAASVTVLPGPPNTNL